MIEVVNRKIHGTGVPSRKRYVYEIVRGRLLILTVRFCHWRRSGALFVDKLHRTELFEENIACQL